MDLFHIHSLEEGPPIWRVLALNLVKLGTFAAYGQQASKGPTGSCIGVFVCVFVGSNSEACDEPPIWKILSFWNVSGPKSVHLAAISGVLTSF